MIMGNSLCQYRAAIGLFNSSRFKFGTIKTSNTATVLFLLLIFQMIVYLIIECIALHEENNYCPLTFHFCAVMQFFFSIIILAYMLLPVDSIAYYVSKTTKYVIDSSKNNYLSHCIGIAISSLIESCIAETYASYYHDRCLLAGDIEINPGPNLISICHLNIRSLSSSKLLALKHQLQNIYDIITLSETFLTSKSSHDLNLDGYHALIRKDRNKAGGGVAAYISSNLAYKRRNDLELPDSECLWLEIHSHNNTFLIAICYRPPDADITFWENMQYMYDLAIGPKHLPTIITGDLNADPNTREGNHLINYAKGNNLTIHIDKATRLTETTSTILDQFLSNIPDNVSKVEVHPPLSTNDHCTISMSISFKMYKPPAFQRHIWLYKDADFDGLNQAITNYDWDECFESDDIDDVLNRWTTSFLNLARQFIPNKYVTIRPKDSPWFTSNLRKQKKLKDKLHKQAQRSNSLDDWSKFRIIRNSYTNALREEELNYKKKMH